MPLLSRVSALMSRPGQTPSAELGRSLMIYSSLDIMPFPGYLQGCSVGILAPLAFIYWWRRVFGWPISEGPSRPRIGDININPDLFRRRPNILVAERINRYLLWVLWQHRGRVMRSWIEAPYPYAVTFFFEMEDSRERQVITRGKRRALRGLQRERDEIQEHSRNKWWECGTNTRK